MICTGLAAIPLLAACHSTEPASAKASAPALARTAAGRPAIRLSNAAPSIDTLVDQFLDALAAKDFNALEQLRVTETEYRTFILPGSVPPGEWPKEYPPTPSVYYWDIMNTKSMYSLRSLLGSYGGQHYRRKAVSFGKGTQDYAWYKAYKKVHVAVEDDQGQESEIDTGSIAEVDGQYKFISFLPK